MTFVLATANPDKAAEIERILADAAAPVELVPRPPDVPEVEETGATLEANARLKAVGLAAATGLPAIADDTGLEVDALGGAPGVYSARFAGPDATYADNCAPPARAPGGVPPSGAPLASPPWPSRAGPTAGRWRPSGWSRARSPTRRGDGGSGTTRCSSPTEGDGRSFAEMRPEEKHAISHRGRAFRTLAEGLRRCTGT